VSHHIPAVGVPIRYDDEGDDDDDDDDNDDYEDGDDDDDDMSPSTGNYRFLIYDTSSCFIPISQMGYFLPRIVKGGFFLYDVCTVTFPFSRL